MPTTHGHTILEYSHRFLAAALVVLLVAILWVVLARARDRRALVWGAAAALALIVPQALLGALTVEHGLDSALVAAHLGVAMVLLAILLALALAVRDRLGTAPASPLLRVLATVSCLSLLAAIVAGGLVAGSELHGTPGAGGAVGAHMACGPDFPSCNGALLPFGEGEAVDLQLTHRLAVLLAAAASISFAVALGRHGLGGLGLAIGMVLAIQLWLGAMNVWAGESPTLIVAHLTVASGLWLLVAAALLLAVTAPTPSPVHARGSE